MSLLMQKTIFSPEYESGQVVIYSVGDLKQFALIVENNEDTLIVAAVRDVLLESDELHKEVKTMEIAVSEIENGEISIQRMEPKLDLKKIFQTFKEVSSMLCDSEHMVASHNKVENQEDIDARHQVRLHDFYELLKKEV